MREPDSTIWLRLNRVGALLCAVRDDRTIPQGIFKNHCNHQFAALYMSDLFEKYAGILPLFSIPVYYRRSNGLHYAIQHSFYVGYKTLTGWAGIDPHPEFRDLNCGTRTSYYADSEIVRCSSPVYVPHRLAVFEHLGIHEFVAAGRANCRNDENIRKIGNIFCGIQVFYLGIACWAGTRNDCTQRLSPTDLVARDLHGHGGKYNIALVAKTDDITIDILCHFL
jgi:hypothetical protein